LPLGCIPCKDVLSKIIYRNRTIYSSTAQVADHASFGWFVTRGDCVVAAHNYNYGGMQKSGYVSCFRCCCQPVGGRLTGAATTCQPFPFSSCVCFLKGQLVAPSCAVTVAVADAQSLKLQNPSYFYFKHKITSQTDTY